MSKLYHLAYISKSALGENEVFVRNEIQQILGAAKRNNPPQGVTGALLYSGGYFCQLLEGPKSNLEYIFEKIMQDDRHEHIEVLFFDPAPDRLFGVWAMAFAGYEARDHINIRGVRPSTEHINGRKMGMNMIETLERMVAERERMLGTEATASV